MYSRELDGEILTLSASGWTYDRLFVLFDYETESLWYHLPGTAALTCIAGKYEGRTLPELSSRYQNWNVWVGNHPASKVLE